MMEFLFFHRSILRLATSLEAEGTIVKPMKTGLLTTSAGCIAALATGCVEHKVVYVPAYQTQQVYQAVPAYTYQPQTTYQTQPAQPGTAAAPTVAPQPDAQPATSSNTVIVAQAPPAPQVEVVPVAPGPAYVWVPGYWSIGVGGGWVWVGGHYGIPPRPHAVWVAGHWGWHGRGYVWVGGHWH